MTEHPSKPRETAHNANVQTALNEWQRVFIQRDWEKLPALLADGVTYSNPGDAMALKGKDALVGSVQLSFSVFEEFEYARQFSSQEGHVLEFRGRVSDVAFTGIDIIRFDATGKIIDLVVMIRPIAAIMTLGQESARRKAMTDHGVQD